MAEAGGDPVPTITEAAAEGATAELYADIRATLGVPVVNLIWRHLAVFPGALEWTWQALKPAYESGAVAAHARALRDGLAIPLLPGLSAAGLRAAGLSGGDLAHIDMIQSAYERSNAMNMVALCAVAARLDGETASAADIAPAPAEAPLVGEMPALLALEAMPAALAQLVQDLNRVGDRDEVLASMYRHLAHWPAYLALIHVLLAPLAAAGALEPLIREIIADGHRRGALLAGGLAEPAEALSGDVLNDLRAAIEIFTDGPIGKMIAIVPLLRRAAPLS